jgi:hypothetical protein
MTVNDTAMLGIGIDMMSGTAEELADRALNSVARKLSKALSVEYTVNKLIAEATDPGNLSSTYYGKGFIIMMSVMLSLTVLLLQDGHLSFRYHVNDPSARSNECTRRVSCHFHYFASQTARNKYDHETAIDRKVGARKETTIDQRWKESCRRITKVVLP